MTASPSDSKLFSKIVKTQRKVRNNTTEKIIFNDEEVEGSQLYESWASYFGKLANPISNSEYDDNYNNNVTFQNNLLENKLNEQERRIPEISIETIKKQVKTLKKGKAADAWGITTEHLIFADESIIDILHVIINRIIIQWSIPADFKHACIITQVFKNKGTAHSPDNYRRITVTALIGKVFEK